MGRRKKKLVDGYLTDEEKSYVLRYVLDSQKKFGQLYFTGIYDRFKDKEVEDPLINFVKAYVEDDIPEYVKYKKIIQKIKWVIFI